MNKTKKNEIQERSYQFAFRVIKLVGVLSHNETGRILILGRQLLRAGMSRGANVEEAI